MRVIPEIIVAVDCAGGFGKEGKIPWVLPEDLKRFKQITTGHVCVMGRRTYEEILDARKLRDDARKIQLPINEILRDRETYVVSSNPDFNTPGATKVSSLSVPMTKMNINNDTRKLFIIGGRRMFIEALSWTNTIHMTVLKGDSYDCDVKFPIDVLNKKFHIDSGEETENAYYVVYKRN